MCVSRQRRGLRFMSAAVVAAVSARSSRVRADVFSKKTLKIMAVKTLRESYARKKVFLGTCGHRTLSRPSPPLLKSFASCSGEKCPGRSRYTSDYWYQPFALIGLSCQVLTVFMRLREERAAGHHGEVLRRKVLRTLEERVRQRVKVGTHWLRPALSFMFFHKPRRRRTE